MCLFLPLLFFSIKTMVFLDWPLFHWALVLHVGGICVCKGTGTGSGTGTDTVYYIY